MGQKVSPVGLRVGINKKWNASWYADKNNFATFLEKDIKIRNYFSKNYKDAGVSNIEIERNPKRCEVIVHTSRPGMVIGKDGKGIEELKNNLKKLIKDDVQISIVDIKKPDLDAQLVADTIARQIEGRSSFRMAQKKAMRNVMKAGAKGVKILASGRLNGVEMARSAGYSEGTIPLHTLRADVDYALSEADTAFGKIGIKVWIYKGEILEEKKAKGGN